MSMNYDSKGKFFTNVITKEAVPAVIQTLTHRIQGYIHIRPGERIKDELDRVETFLAVTDARVFDARGTVIHTSDFISINRNHVVWVIPVEEDAAPTAPHQE
ncbi:MAG: hypothetical protein OHK0052_22550 [Anaerolineales bacterium]